MKKHDCFHFEEEPAKRERPDWAGPADTTPVGQYWDVQHKPCPPVGQYWDAHHKPCPPVPDCGYGMPPLMPPIPPFNPNLSMPGQVEALNCKVNELIKTLNCYSENVYGAYSAIVHSALCNDAYYREVTIEEGYIPDASAKYKVVHIPFLDKAGEPIYLELGLAYNNSTNSGVREKSFDASQRFLADKIIPATNVGTNWYGHPIWKNAPIPTTVVEGMKYTVGITEGGFIKWYANSVDDRTMQIDKVRNAMGVRSVLIAGGELSQNMWETTESTQLARVGIGMNYQTKERFIVVVEGSDRTGCTIEQFANIFKGYECDVAVECANGDSSYMLDKGEMAVMPSTVNAMNIPTVPDSNCFWYITKRRHYKNQYVKDVAVLTQRVGQEIWNTELTDTAVDKVKAEVVNLNNRLEDEIQNRKDADEHLADLIADETDARIAGDEKLDNRITNEVATLNARIDSEVEKLNAVDAKLREDLTAETQNRIANDIASVELVQDGTKDIYRLKKNDGTAIEVPIELYNYTLLVQKLDTLSQVEVRLNAEIEARKAADDKIEAKVDTEIADRKAADADLQKQINDNKSSTDAALAQEVADRKAADAKEVADRIQADADMDAALKALIKAEENARTAGDTALANQIADLTGKFNTFKNATEGDIAGIETNVETLTESLNALTETVSANKTDLESKLTALTARVTAEETTTADNVVKIAQLVAQTNALQTTVSALNETVTALQSSFASTEQSFENVKQTVANMQTELNTFETTVNTKLTELEGKFGDYLSLAGGTMSGYIILNTPEIEVSPESSTSAMLGKNVLVLTRADSSKTKDEVTITTTTEPTIIDAYGINLGKRTTSTTIGAVTMTESEGKPILGASAFTFSDNVHKSDPDSEYVFKETAYNVYPSQLNGINVLRFDGPQVYSDINDDAAFLCVGGVITGESALVSKKRGDTSYWRTAIVDVAYGFNNLANLEVKDGEYPDDAVTKRQLDAAVTDVNPSGKYLLLTGGTMTGDLNFHSAKLHFGNNGNISFDATGLVLDRCEKAIFRAGSSEYVIDGISDSGVPVVVFKANDESETPVRVSGAPAVENNEFVTKSQIENIISTIEFNISFNAMTIKGKSENTYAPILLGISQFKLDGSVLNIIPPYLDNKLHLFVSLSRTEKPNEYMCALYGINISVLDVNISEHQDKITCYYKPN